MRPIDLKGLAELHITPKMLDGVANDWFVFGESRDTVDIADIDGDVFESVPREIAGRILELRSNFRNDLKAILNGRLAAPRPLPASA